MGQKWQNLARSDQLKRVFSEIFLFCRTAAEFTVFSS